MPETRDSVSQTPQHTPGVTYCVYSREHNYWWRPRAAGYTNSLKEAGRFTLEEAKKHASSRSRTERDDGAREFYHLSPESAAATAALYEALRALCNNAIPCEMGDGSPDMVDGLRFSDIEDARAALAIAEGGA